MVYVDDFKLVGPKNNLKKGWELLREKLIIEPETGLEYLGCNQFKGTVGCSATAIRSPLYDMEQFLRSWFDRYLEVAGNVELKKVPTPGPHEETKDHPSRAPIQTGPSVECNWCGNRVPANGYETPSCHAGGTSEGAHPEPVRGQLAPHAASVLMKELYGARIARFDLLWQVNRLARNITRWTTDDDEKLHYIHHTKHWRMIGWVGGSVEDMYLVVHSTPEAEIVAADVAMRAMGMPALRLMERILGKEPKLVFFDDNKAMISVARSGKNPTKRYPERSHGVAVTWMHDMFERDYMYLAYEVTDRMAADIYTKAFSGSRKWKLDCLSRKC